MITESGHVSVAYVSYACASCRNTKVEPANDPLFPNRMRKHEYAQITTAQVSSTSAVHTCKKWGCTVSEDCSYFEVETHQYCLKTDWGHFHSNLHNYKYECMNADCGFTVIIAQECDDNCPVHIYRKRIEQEQQKMEENVQ